jgi:hypothetical protein
MIDTEVRPVESAAGQREEQVESELVLRIERERLRSTTPAVQFERASVSGEAGPVPELVEIALRQPIVL